MSLLDIIGGDFGQVIELTFVDVDTDAAADIGDYTTTIQMIFTSPSGVETEKTATFKSDGSDGVIQYTVEEGLLTAGKWRVRGRVQSASAKLTTTKHSFKVLS
jgi:hypothetical protein